MNLGLRTVRLSSSSSIKVLTRPPTTRFFQKSAPLAMNSTTAAYQTSFGAEGNLGIAPKQMSPIQNLKLNDGKEIPMASL